jgi:hypothetical protein
MKLGSKQRRWRGEREEGWDDEEEGKRNLIAESTVEGCGVVIDDDSNSRSKRDPE